MASLTERKHSSGRVTWRVVLRRKGIRTFSLTFDDIDTACDWIEKNEQLFYQNPDKYFKWRDEQVYSMQRKREYVRNHIVRPKPRGRLV